MYHKQNEVYRYALTFAGIGKVKNNLFFMQATKRYKGYTEIIFRVLYESKKALTIEEIRNIIKKTKNLNLKSSTIGGAMIAYLRSGEIKRIIPCN